MHFPSEQERDEAERGVVQDLTGRWRFAFDREDLGVQEKWFLKELSEEVVLPGSLDVQGLGDPVMVDTQWTGTVFDRSFYDSPLYEKYRKPGRVRVPFWLQPETRYVGAAWYQTEFCLGARFENKSVRLSLERAHWQTRVWLDDREIGVGESLATPHVFELGELETGRSHRLTIRVDNRLSIAVGENAHSVSDQTQGNWNGIVGSIQLIGTEKVRVDSLDVYPIVGDRAIRVVGRIAGNQGKELVQLKVREEKDGHSDSLVWVSFSVELEDACFELRLDLAADAVLWDEFNPVLYELEASVSNDVKRVTFGLREFQCMGTQFAINGEKTFLRGTLDCCIFPLTGHPPMDVASWKEILGTIKRDGLNHVRFHSWCPPEAAFVAGDELGVYFQVECGVWPNSDAVLGYHSPAGIGDGASVDRWVYKEGERILKTYGNHPCFVMMACGNEPGGPRHREYLSEWLAHFRALDSRRVYSGMAGWPELPEDEFHVVSNSRIHQWGDGLKCRLNAEPPATTYDYREIVARSEVPIVSHEIGQWCSYPAIGDVANYQGHLKPTSYDIIRDSLIANHMEDQARDFLYVSGKLQALCYREEIESSLRTPGLAGFQLLGLQDFSGQGTAPVGMLNAFWKEKGYVDATEMRRFCSETVLLARLEKRVFSSDETLAAEIEVAHYGAESIARAGLSWSLLSEDGVTVVRGSLPARAVEREACVSLGLVTVSLAACRPPARYRLAVTLSGIENSWDIWVFQKREEPVAISCKQIVSELSDAVPLLEQGREVLLIAGKEAVANEIALGFTPIFWNTACTQGQAPHTLGLLCDREHPALAAFPTDSFANWHWWYLIRKAAPMVLDALPGAFRPIVQVVDDWYTNRKLGLLWEAKVGAGRLLVCSIDLKARSGNPEEDLVCEQFLQSLLSYMESSAFDPVDRLTIEDVRKSLRSE